MLTRVLLIVVVLSVVSSVRAADPSPRPFVINVPDTISPEAQEYLRSLKGPGDRPAVPALSDAAGWKKFVEEGEASREPVVQRVLKQYGPTVEERKLGGVSVLDVKPKNWVDNHQVLVYVHGGAYVRYSAHSTLPGSVVVADATGLRVISVDYSLAPAAKWPQATDEVIAVLEALVHDGFKLSDIGIYGDSAGGGLAPGAVLKMRDKGLGMPAVVVLWSPWADITDRGDSAVTLKDAEPTYLYELHLKPAADAYADPKDQKNPYVSPVYADFTKGFPPTLVQGGTKEIFLSHFVRLYQALDKAGVPVKLDLYDAMPHVFQWRLDGAPEGQLALKKMNAFLKQYLGK